jgi:ribosome-associated protein
VAAKSKADSQQPRPSNDQEARSESVRNFAIEAARLAASTRCRNVVLLDVRTISPVTDYMIIATGTSPRQMRTVLDETAEFGEARGYAPMSHSGYDGESWMLLDFVDVILHVLGDEARVYYDLDNLWGDARRVDWQTGMPQPAASPSM